MAPVSAESIDQRANGTLFHASIASDDCAIGIGTLGMFDEGTDCGEETRSCPCIAKVDFCTSGWDGECALTTLND